VGVAVIEEVHEDVGIDEISAHSSHPARNAARRLTRTALHGR
jgi:hypothetical protein